MDLTGHLIKGTGSYEIKEIAPPVESGQLITDSTFQNWSGGLLDDWTESIGVSSSIEETTNGVRMVSDGASSCQLAQPSMVVGRWYKAKVIIYSLTSGAVQVGTIGDLKNCDAVGLHEHIFQAAVTTSFYITRNGVTDLVVQLAEVEEVPQGYPLLDKGSKYLECTTGGTISMLSNQAYGEWEFDLYKSGDAYTQYANFILTSSDLSTAEGYQIFFYPTSNLIDFRYITGGVTYRLWCTANNYIDAGVWYRLKVTRTLDGEFTAYIKGGGFGVDDWTLISTSGGSGTNPVTHNTYKISNYFGFDLDANDRAGGLIITNQVRQ